MSNDHVIVDKIRVALEQGLSAAPPDQVAVSEQAGTVTLRGSVASPGQRRAAVRHRQGRGRVRHVEDQLRVDHRIASPTIRSVVSRFGSDV